MNFIKTFLFFCWLNSEKTLNELGDKISGEEKAKIENEIEATKKALESNDTEAIKEAT